MQLWLIDSRMSLVHIIPPPGEGEGLRWAGARWCSATWGGRSGRSCCGWRSCSPPQWWAPDTPNPRWAAAGAAEAEPPAGPAAGRAGSEPQQRHRVARRNHSERKRMQKPRGTWTPEPHVTANKHELTVRNSKTFSIHSVITENNNWR